MLFPKNVVIWTLPRAGSTSMLYGIRDAMKASNLRQVQQLWEGTGVWGILRLRDYKQIGRNIDFSKSIDHTEKLSVDYRHWIVGKHGVLRSVTATGDPRVEVDNRVNLLREGNWINSVVFKNMRWSPESIDRVYLNKEFDDAIFASPQSFHHVILWRRNIFDWLCSRFVFMRVGIAHGTYEWDGTTFISNNWRPIKVRKQVYRVIDEFVNTFDIIPKHNTIMVETGDINSMKKISWPDETTLPLPKDVFKQDLGQMSYINLITQEKVKPVDLLQSCHIDLFSELAEEIDQRYDWQNLDKNSGFKLHE